MSDQHDYAALATQLGELRAEVATLRAKTEGETGPYMTVLMAVRRLRDQVETIERALSEAVETHKVGEGPQPVMWTELDGAELAAQTSELTDWVNVFLKSQYPSYTAGLHACWAEHPECLWELDTIRQEWRRIYGDPEARNLAGALEWHNRYFPAVMARLTSVLERCKDRHEAEA